MMDTLLGNYDAIIKNQHLIGETITLYIVQAILGIIYYFIVSYMTRVVIKLTDKRIEEERSIKGIIIENIKIVLGISGIMTIGILITYSLNVVLHYHNDTASSNVFLIFGFLLGIFKAFKKQGMKFFTEYLETVNSFLKQIFLALLYIMLIMVVLSLIFTSKI